MGSELEERESYVDQEAPTYNYTDISPQEFLQHLWPKGHPLVIRGVKKKGKWDPGYWIERYGHECVTLENCETGETKASTVGEYLSTYGEMSPRKEIWKLKARLSTASLYNNRLTSCTSGLASPREF